jgi:hypothetical protein
MGVEMDQGQRPVFRDMRLQQRIGDEMIAAEGCQKYVMLDDLGRRALDRAGMVCGMAWSK